MGRRMYAGIIAAVVWSTLFVGTAVAAPAATAQITSALDVVPGDVSYVVYVRNGESGLQAPSINAVEITLPGAAGISLRATPTSNGWTGTSADAGRTARFAGGAIAPDASASFTLPSSVERPLAVDACAAFEVRVSSDAGQSYGAAAPTGSGLSTCVRILELVDGPRPTTPTSADGSKGVSDGSATARQVVVFTTKVRNHARDAVDADVVLTPSSTVDVADAPARRTIAPLSTVTVQTSVRLGDATAQRTVTVIGDARGSGADATDRSFTLTVQVPTSLSPNAASLSPSTVRPGRTTFSLSVSKSGGAALTVTDAVVTFGGISTPVKGLPIEFGAGNQPARTVQADVDVPPTEGTFPVTLTWSGTDANLAAASGSPGAGQITIDTTPPTITSLQVSMPVDGDGNRRPALKSGETVSVTASGQGGTAWTVVMRPDRGADVPITPSVSPQPGGSSLTGSAAPTWHPDATSAVVVVELRDAAGNVGTATSAPFRIDNRPPTLADASLLSATLVQLVFVDPSGVRGGCDASSWSFPWVAEVRGAGGGVCGSIAAGQAGDGVRQLILRRPVGPDEPPPAITYSPSPSLPLGLFNGNLRDGVDNALPASTVEPKDRRVPATPTLTAVQRRDAASGSYEAAYRHPDGTAYTTGGAAAVRLQVAGLRQGYRVRVLDDAGTTVAEAPAGTADPLNGEATAVVDVPLASREGRVTLSIHAVTGSGNLSWPVRLPVVVDTSAPTILSAARSASARVDVTFSEPIAAGRNAMADWYVLDAAGTAVMPESVEIVSSTVRRLVLPTDVADPRVGYVYAGPAGQRYEDRAGNTLADRPA